MTAGAISTPSAAAPPASRAVIAGARPAAGILLQLGLAGLVILTYALEGPRFATMFTLATGGFVVHAVLPRSLRQPWFVLLSLAGIGIILGVANGLWLVGIGAGLMALCHLPVVWWARAALVVTAGLALAVFRVIPAGLPFSAVVWPILGSMFMFRLAIYLHHLRHHPGPFAPGRALAYFFMLPNVVFPLFPVIDYKTFGATWFDREAAVIYQTGLRHIARGLLHLVAHRFVYFHLVQDPADLANLADLLTYIVATFLVYLRVSGQFHIIVGILHLFGYRLPRTNNNYFLATSFTDVWRRINIYWKDFMVKLVYFPSFFLFRRRGQRVGLVGATMMVFLVTWVLHSYQWFWLRGDFPLRATDMLYWGGIGIFMVVELQRETAQAPGQTALRRAWDATRAFKTLGLFSLYAVFWALWESETVADFLALWTVAGEFDDRTIAGVALICCAALAIFGWPWAVPGLADPKSVPAWRRDDLQTVVTCLGLLALAQPVVTDRLGGPVTALAQSLRGTGLNARDAASQHRGYYQQLNAVGGLGAGQLAEPLRVLPADWLRLQDTPMYLRRRDLLGGELAPDMRQTIRGAVLTTNRWGMRDQDYALENPAGTVRLAVLGPSDVMGSGVNDGEAFEAVLETQLNQGRAGESTTRYEVLNFAVGGHTPLQQMEQLAAKVFQFQPDLVAVTHHPVTDSRGASDHLARIATAGGEVTHPTLQRFIAEAGVRAGMRTGEANRRLRPYGDSLVVLAVEEAHARITGRGVPAILLVLQLPGEASAGDGPAIAAARRLGFEVIDLRDAFDGHDPRGLQVAEHDAHPNPRGHQLLADRLFAELLDRPGLLSRRVP